MDNANKINTNTLSVNSLLMKEPYFGLFDICGGLSVSGNTKMNNVTINGNSLFNGSATFTNSFNAAGNVDSNDSVNVKNDIVLGNTIYFDNKKLQFIYGNSSGLGINTYFPHSALDISTNLISGFNIYSSQIQNISTLAQNNQQKGIQVGVDINTTYINMFNDHTIASGIVDGNITYTNGGVLTMDVQKNINLLAPISISNRGNVSHINDETVVIYDTSKNIFFGNIYNNTQAITGAGLSIISNDLSSNTFMYLTTSDKKGSGIGGGAYPDDVTRSMGVIILRDSSGQHTPSQIIVTGNDIVKYKTTTGINTFKPRLDNYVLDINGPIHVDNGDITNTNNQNFEIYSMSNPKKYKNNILAVGSSVDIIGTDNIYREKLLKSIDYGKSWSTLDIPILFKDMNEIKSVYMYDQSSCFITGQINFLQYSPDGGYNWNNLTNSLKINNNNNFYVNPKQKIDGNIVCYFSVDVSCTFFTFEMPISGSSNYNTFAANGFNINPITIDAKIHIDRINSIHGNDSSLYLAGDSIVKYNVSNENWTELNTPNVHKISSYSYNGINAFDNSFVIAVGENIISSTTDGGLNWIDTTLNNVNLNSVYIYDLSSAVAVGSQGNIWVTNNSGLTWNYMPLNLLNSSGKSSFISSTKNNFKNVVMPDINTIVVSNNTQSYTQGVKSGISNMYNMFVPNFLNRSNNIVFDVSGTVNISGDLKMSDNGEIVSTNHTMNLFRKNVQILNIGEGVETINMGNTLVGNTVIKNNLISNGIATFGNSVFVIGNAVLANVQVNNTTLLNGVVGINTIPKFTLDISGNIYTRSELYVFNKMGVNTTTPQYDVDISGIVNIHNNLFVLSDVSMSANVYIFGNLECDSMSKFNSGLLVNKSDITVTGNIYGNIYPLVDTIEIGGGNNDIYIGGKTNTNREQNIYIGQGGGVTNKANSSKIYIGSQNDYVYLRGNTTILQQVQQEVTSSTVVVNKSGTGANASAAGSGIDIYDNSYSNFANKNIYGYIHVGNDLQSYVFKAPSYGAYNGGTPAPNTNNNLQLISPENRVRLGVNELKLAKNKYMPVTGNVRTGLLVLQTNTDFVNYQTGLGHNYTDSGDADYAINISNAFDISNIMLKLFDTDIGNQVIGSNLVIGNSNVPYNLSVYGNAIIRKNVIINGNAEIYGNTILPNITITNTMIANGNIILNGNIGIGTNTPQILLDVSGNVRFIGEMVNTNYDSIQFPTNFNTNWCDNSGQALSNSYYQDFAMSYDGQYQYGLLYNKTGVSSIIKSDNFGSSWSQIPLTGQASLNTIGQAVPVMSSKTVTFSSTTLGQNILVGSVPLNTQIGIYDAIGSSGSNAYYVFDNVDTTSWISETNDYGASANTEINSETNYFGTFSTDLKNTTDNQGVWTSPIYGEYIQISLPYSFVITSITIANDDTNKSVYRFTVVGSSNGNDWYILSSCDFANINAVPKTGSRTYNSNFFNNLDASKSYRYFRIIVIQTYNSQRDGGPNNEKTSIKSINMSGTVQNSTGTYAATISSSGNGKFVTVANQGYNNNTGNIFVSSDYGSTYTNTNVQPIQRDGSGIWQSVAVSQSGQYQFSAISSIYGRGNIWKSMDYGSSWVDSLFGVYNGFQCITVSSSGQYVTAIQSGNSTVPRGNIWVSNDYGGTWSSSQQIYSYMQFNNGFLNEGSVDFNKIVSVSVNGKYQTAIGIAPSNTTDSINSNIWYNNNYGQGSWIDSGYSVPVMNGTYSVLSSVSMTGSGKYQTVSFIGGNSNVSSQVYGNILRSTDYGVTWKDSAFKVPSTKNVNGDTVYGYLPKVVASVNGQIITGISKYESLRDMSYNNNNSSQVAVGNIFTSVIPTTSQMNTTQYFGSPHTGNVFQVHGLQLNVPNDNNASLMMGYDTAWDSAYINSADQYGYSSLCLNTVGGSIGIAKINPDPRFSLDISGIVNITNENGVILLQGNSSNNMGVGKSVLNSITSGSNNTAFGYNSLSSITSGSNNTAVGYGAFSNASNYIQSTAIGFNAQPTKNNQIVLGTSTETVFIPGITASTNSTSGALQVVGGVGIGGNVTIDGNTSIGGNLYVGSKSIFNNDVSFNSGGVVSIMSNRPNFGTSSRGALQVVGGVGIGGNVTIDGTLNTINLPQCWNAQALGLNVYDSTNTQKYYLLGKMGDYNASGNFGSMNIKGSIGGYVSTSSVYIDCTIITRLNSTSTPFITGTTRNFLSNSIGNADICIYYYSTSTSGESNDLCYYVYLVLKKNLGEKNYLHFDLTITGNNNNNNTIKLMQPSNVSITVPTIYTLIVSSVLTTVANIMTINNGMVGINTTIPTYALDVSGNARIGGIGGSLIIGQYNNTQRTGSIGGQLLFGGTYGDPETSHANITNRIYAATELSELVIFKGNDVDGNSGPDRIRLRAGAIAFDTYSIPTTDYTADSIRMYINSNGNVGIGTTSPVCQLDVNNEISIRSSNSASNGGSQTSTLGFGYGATTRYRWKIDDVTINRSSGFPNWDYGFQSKLIFSCKSNNTYGSDDADKLYYQGLTLVPNSPGNSIESTGINVGINTTIPTYALEVVGSVRIGNNADYNKLLVLWDGGSSDSKESATNFFGFGINSSTLRFQVPGSHIFRFYVGTENVAWIDESSIFCGKKSKGSLMLCNGDSSYPGYIGFYKPDDSNPIKTRVAYIGYGNSANYIGMNIENGYVGFECNGILKAESFNATSDYRLKTNIKPLKSNNVIDLLHPIEYDLSGGKHNMGFLAHEVQEIFPFLVDGEKDSKDIQSINYNGFIALLVKEVQDLKKENKVLQEKNDGFENRFKVLESMILTLSQEK